VRKARVERSSRRRSCGEQAARWFRTRNAVHPMRGRRWHNSLNPSDSAGQQSPQLSNRIRAGASNWAKDRRRRTRQRGVPARRGEPPAGPFALGDRRGPAPPTVARASLLTDACQPSGHPERPAAPFGAGEPVRPPRRNKVANLASGWVASSGASHQKRATGLRPTVGHPIDQPSRPGGDRIHQVGRNRKSDRPHTCQCGRDGWLMRSLGRQKKLSAAGVPAAAGYSSRRNVVDYMVWRPEDAPQTSSFLAPIKVRRRSANRAASNGFLNVSLMLDRSKLVELPSSGSRAIRITSANSLLRRRF
jgi:hypothetical protein